MAEEGNMEVLERGPRQNKPEKGFLQKTTTRIGLIGGGLVLAGAGVGARMGFFERGDSPRQVSIATVPATAIPTEGPQLATPMPTETAMPTVTATSTPEANPDAKFPPATPEIEAFDCGFFSPEVCATGKYIQWSLPNGRQVEGIGFVIKKAGEKLTIPESFQVAVESIKQPNPYNGYRITGVNKDGQQFTIFGDSIPAEGLTNVGKDLPGGSTIGTSGGSDLTVFPEYPYTHILLIPDLKTRFAKETENPPKIINNAPSSSTSRGGVTFYDVKPPTQQ